ncbi:MAG: DUF2244 domain-containing protein [Gammaproteobacteria bacterium]|jgi:uncharacterized membrane protein|nr:DUF2244 domain-containing protein [Gammaproteobacteria bacterium]NCF83653.1 DUF2244 domain-containing protein [Pseudomonadota bacterium]
MVSSTVDTKRNWRIVIRPNRSLTRRQLQLAFFGIAVVCLGIAGAFAVIGLWPILPFAGVEVIVVGIGFYLSARGGQEMEVVSVGGDKVAVEKGRRQVSRRWEMQRAWTQIRLLPPKIRWYPSRLVLGSHGKALELGGFLSEQERQLLAGQLQCAIRESGQ